MTSKMTSNKPYIIRAFYDWISDNDMTPYIVVDVSVYGVLVPMSYVNDGQIVLNISGGAVGAISLQSEQIELSARFGGKLEHIVVPYGAVAAIYSKENGAGTSLAIEHPESDAGSEIGLKSENKKPTATLAEVSTVSGATATSADESAKPKSKAKGKPSLKVIK